jgi:hypothetical protein
VSFRLNHNIELKRYKSYLEQSFVSIIGTDRCFMVVESDTFSHTRQMVKYEQKKKAINGSALDKMIVLENNSYVLLLPNMTKEDYYYSK